MTLEHPPPWSGDGPVIPGSLAPPAIDPGAPASLSSPTDRDVHGLLDAVFRNSTEAVVIADHRGAITYATTGAMLLTGYDAEGIIGTSLFDFLHPDDVDAAAQLFARRLEFDGADLGHEIRIRHSSGEWIGVLATVALLPDGSPGACALTLRDATGTSTLERSLRSRIVVGEYANRLSAGFMEATDAVDVLDRITTSLGEIGLLTGAEVVEVLLEQQRHGPVERLARWVSPSGNLADRRDEPGSTIVRETAEPLLAGEVVVAAVEEPPPGAGAATDAVPAVRVPTGAIGFCRRHGAHSLISAPFSVGDQRGTVVLMRLAPGPDWSGADVQLLRSVAGLYGRALHTARSEELLALTYREGPLGFCLRTWDGLLVDCNQRYLDMNRITRSKAMTSGVDAAPAPEHQARVAAEVGRLRRGEIDRIRLDVEVVRGDGTRYWARINAVPLEVPGSTERLVLISLDDVTETHVQRVGLEYAASHDPLTGLANRTAMTDAIERLALVEHEQPALLFIDLDRFKSVNDSFGHSVGDQLLQLVAQRIRSAVRSVDVVARLGGDEFAVVVPGLTGAGAHRLARRLQRSVEPRFTIDGRSINQAFSIGVAMGHGIVSASDLLVRADRALHAAKAAGRNRYVIYDAELEEEVVARLDLESELRAAVAGELLEVFFQPEFDTADGRIVGAEALVRWNHPRLGLLPAERFITIAEQTGMIADIGRFALRHACVAFAAIDGTAGLTLRVNISAREFVRPELLALVKAALAESGIDAACLCLEMTETTVMDAPELALETITRLRAIGVTSAIDDFGTGYSSLAYLKRFPVDAVKIDRAFVEDIVSDPDSRAIVDTIMRLSEALSLQTVAEGVETVEQLDALRALGCQRAQGFLVAPALPPAEFAAMLTDRRAGPSDVAPPMPRLRPASCTGSGAAGRPPRRAPGDGTPRTR